MKQTERNLTITIVDYGAGNLRSVDNAIKKLGYQSKITSSPNDVLDARILILPGVGAAPDAMSNLEKLNLVNPLRSYITEGRPFLGICLGLQVLLDATEEGGGYECLGVIPGKVRKLPEGQKIPHMGWNQVKQKISHPVFKGVPDGKNFYFVHSYYVDPEEKSMVAGETDYSVPFCSAVARGNLVATQFHPEKSGDIGLRVFNNFINLAMEKNNAD